MSDCPNINQKNFFKKTECVWHTLRPLSGYEHITSRYPDYSSGGSSKYWYCEDGVYRLSDHWGSHIRSCNWFLDAFPDEIEERMDAVYFDHQHDYEEFLGFARWEDFSVVDS